MFCTMASIQMGAAQSERVTAEEINIQKIFIEASKNKLLGAYEEAERLFKEVLEKDKSNDVAAYELSRVYLSQSKLSEATDAVKLAIRIDGTVEWYYILKADILKEQMEFGDAALEFENLIKLNPDQNFYYEELAELYKKDNQIDKALATLDLYEAKVGIVEPVIRNKFDILNEQGKPEKALDELDKLIRLYPYEMDYLQLAAAYCKQVNMDQRANAYYQKIIEIDPDDARANVALASTFKSEGKDIAYLHSIQAIINNPSINLDVKIQEMIPFIQKISEKRDPELETALFEALTNLNKIHPHEAKVHAILADLYFHTDQLSEARKEYEKTVALDDGVYEVWDQLMFIIIQQKDWSSLIKTSEDAMDVFPNQGSIYYYNGMAYERKEDFLEAESSFTQALLMSGRDLHLRFNVLASLGQIYFQMTKVEKGKEAFDKALDINPKSYSLLNSYARILATKDEDLPEAESLLKKAMDLQDKDYRVWQTSAFISARKKDFQKALKDLEKSTSFGGDKSPAVMELMGDVQLELGDLPAAVEAWQNAIHLGADNERLKKKVNEHKIN